MAETVDLQGQAIAIGTLVAVLLVAYGTLVNDTIVGYEALTLAMWAFAATFGAIALLHLLFGRTDMALAYTGGTFGWILLLLGGSGVRTGLGLLLFLLGGAYIVQITLSERDGTPSE